MCHIKITFAIFEFYFTSETIYINQTSRLYFHYFFAIPNPRVLVLLSLEQSPLYSFLFSSMVVSSQCNTLTDQDISANTERSTPLQTPIVSSTTSDKGIELILILGHEEECKKVWETHVLLLVSLNFRDIFFVGPYRPKLGYEAISSWLPTYENEYPIIHKETIRSDFLKDTSGIFRPSPPKDRKTFFSWLMHIEAKKS